MDTSIRLEKLQIVAGKSFTANERARLVAYEILEAVKPYLTYLSGFISLNDLITSTGGLVPYDAILWPTGVVQHKLPPGTTLRTRVRRLHLLEQKGGQSKGRNARRTFELWWTYEKYILITNSGDVLVWDLAIYRLRRGKVRSARVRSKFRTLVGRSLAKYLGDESCARGMINALGWTVTDTAEARRRRLKATEELDAFIKGAEKFVW